MYKATVGPSGGTRWCKKLKAAIKYLASFAKTDWELKDYPIRYKRMGGGQTRKDAYEQLVANLESYRRSRGALPRPGTTVPVEFAPTDEIEDHEDLAREFFRKILDIDYDHSLFIITDRASLAEITWTRGVTDDEANDRILAEYGVDVTDIEDRNIVAILRRIQETRRG